MTIDECIENVGCLVRVDRKTGRNPHHGRARLTGVKGQMAVILPWGRHRRDEFVEPKFLKIWKSKSNPLSEDFAEERLESIPEASSPAVSVESPFTPLAIEETMSQTEILQPQKEFAGIDEPVNRSIVQPCSTNVNFSDFIRMRDNLLSSIRARLEQVEKDRSDLESLVAIADEEIGECHKQLAELGGAKGQSSQLAEDATSDVEKVLAVFRERREIWMRGSYAMKIAGIVTSFPGAILGPLVTTGVLMKKGQKNGTEYMMRDKD